MQDGLANIWRRVIIGEGKGWVLFSHGTCVILADPRGAIDDQALAIMRDWGPVHAGSAAGDFTVIDLEAVPGWAVACHHPDVLTYVSPDEMPPDPSELEVGLYGRSKRQQDADDLVILHVEQPR